MALSNSELWHRIQMFEIDDENSTLSFLKRLARENSWSLEFSNQVITEYKRFTYLACVSAKPVTPSDEVDQAWHLHLVYTRSYWEEFCDQVLQMKLHHGPTKGGRQEAEKYQDLYDYTKELYEAEFGEAPPIDIWPDSEIRFSKPMNIKKIDTKEKWVISKPRLDKYSSVACSLLLLTLSGCTVLGVEVNEELLFFVCIGLFFVFRTWQEIASNNGNDKKKGGCSGGCSTDDCGGGSGCGGD